MAVQVVLPRTKSARNRSKKSICLISIAASLAKIHGLHPLLNAKTLHRACGPNRASRVACAHGWQRLPPAIWSMPLPPRNASGSAPCDTQ